MQEKNKLLLDKTAYIVSLKFAPGLKKEFQVLGENIRKKGINVKYLLSGRYEKLDSKNNNVEHITKNDTPKGMVLETIKCINSNKIFKILSKNHPVFICFYNPHPLNPFIARFIKKNFSDSILSLYLHDPYKPDKKPYGFAKAAYISMAEWVQSHTIRYMDYVISPSEYSSQLFRLRYPKFRGKNYMAPLLVPDQRKEERTERRYFSIVGGAHPATGHDTFIELVNYVADKGLPYEFTLISSSNIETFINRLSEKGKKKLKVINKKIITDSEINEVIRESYAVFRLDREVTQSGVIPVAYMNETPIIARDIPGLRQHITHKENGYLVPLDCSPENLVEAMEFTKSKFEELSKNDRKDYEETWAEWNWDKYYSWLTNLLQKGNSI